MSAASHTNAIACSGVTVEFDGFVALNDVALDVPAGKTVALIGPNGAGKTTLLNAISGRVPMKSGRVELWGDDITRLPVAGRTRRGLGRSFQIINLFQEMTTFENLRVAAQPPRFNLQPFWRPVNRWSELGDRAREVAAVVGLSDVLDMPVATLSHGRQRAVELGLALMADPRVLLLDEPLAGVGHNEIASTMELIERVRENRTVLLVEHNMEVVMKLSDEIVVMMGGEVLMRGTPAEVRNDERVKRAYLGDEEGTEATHA
ncbi:ABC transporter ATP-binding protein [Hydrogenophaga laconesensis]|uniref:Branched-chain amino acid transport system ATP-binding protein n=1 Tax=Hydrogenophaga laconesensis TaxID=1805971 RepID=A0ABU1V8T5_9BURK|nr:ABC transporter ATP-binding protein [Hydrogenophaga laconesensis]MDR7093871.1 branched-chain amino acid transport system ATP-binding protein [Hydrogenophaga laconesensis]